MKCEPVFRKTWVGALLFFFLAIPFLGWRLCWSSTQSHLKNHKLARHAFVRLLLNGRKEPGFASQLAFLLSHAATMVLLAPLLFRWRDCSGFRPSPEVDLDKGGLSW
mmetsp:Transcript_29968/g.82253  ORF Transcript_29968/g.82253 Transcript_29968/m.82253 type:complete len:107 (+) Transcript_29968:725-1045(+)